MKKIFLVCLTLIILLSSIVPAYCETQGPFRKLARGTCNLLTFPAEIVNRIKKTNDTSGPYEAATYGLLQGVCMTIVRAAAGVYEILTFPVPLPGKYEPVLNDPEFF